MVNIKKGFMMVLSVIDSIPKVVSQTQNASREDLSQAVVFLELTKQQIIGLIMKKWGSTNLK